MTLTLYHYANCGTCKNAQRWLADRGLVVTAIDLVATPPDVATLADVQRLAGLEARQLFNTSGLVYRGDHWADRVPGMADAAIHEALAGNGRLIKRPLLLLRRANGTGAALVGFREAAWQALLG